jgi:hypothetical protein
VDPAPIVGLRTISSKKRVVPVLRHPVLCEAELLTIRAEPMVNQFLVEQVELALAVLNGLMDLLA